MSAQDLYELLPAIYRIRDGQGGGVLEALLAIVQGEADRVADDLEDLYDDWFIETCRDWVVPYLGELLSTRGPYAFGEGALSLRAFVADTLSFRRRKGTASMLEDLALSVTGWTCRSVEMFQRVATTQHGNHARPAAAATASLRGAAALERIDGPFDGTRRLVDVRGARGGRPRPNVANVTLFLWRLAALEATEAAALADPAAGPGRFRFDPLGVDRALFGPARTLDDRARSVTEADVPGPLHRRPLYDELSAAREAIAAGAPPRYHHFPPGQEVLTITPAGEAAPIPPEQIQICNLDAWATLPAPIAVTRPDGSTFATRVAVDPRSGRIAFLGAAPAAVRVTYHYGAAAAIGAGHAPREHAAPADQTLAVADWGLAQSPALASALAAWTAAGRPRRTIELADSGRYAPPPAVTVPAGGRLVVRARGGRRPVIALAAPWQITLEAGATLVLDGLLLTGGALAVRVQAAGGATAGLELRHATIVPGLGRTGAGAPASPAAVVLHTEEASAGALRAVIDRSIVGRVDLTRGAPGFVSDVHVSDSVLDDAGHPDDVLSAHGLTVARATVLGAARARTLVATDAIFTRRLTVERTQEGSVRFSYVPRGSKVPRTYRCQPALALAAPDADAALIAARLVPAFTTTRFGDAAYVQLAASCPAELRAGGSDGSEMGAHFHLQQPQREANLRQGLDEYLRFGLEAGLVFVT